MFKIIKSFKTVKSELLLARCHCNYRAMCGDKSHTHPCSHPEETFFLSKPLYTQNIKLHTASAQYMLKNNAPPPPPAPPRPADLPGGHALSLPRNKQKQTRQTKKQK